MAGQTLVACEETVRKSEIGALAVGNGPTPGVARSGSRTAISAEDGIVEEGAVGDDGLAEVLHGPSEGCLAIDGGGTRCADGLVVDEDAVADLEGSPGVIVEGPAVTVGSCSSLRPVPVQHDLVEGQLPSVVSDAAAHWCDSFGDRQSGDARLDTARNVEDPAGIVATNREAEGAWPFECQVVSDVQFATSQGDLATDSLGERNQVRSGVGVRLLDRVAERTGGRVICIDDSEGTRQGPVLEDIETGPETARGRAPRVSTVTQQAVIPTEGRGSKHGQSPSERQGLLENDKSVALGAQTVRPSLVLVGKG